MLFFFITLFVFCRAQTFCQCTQPFVYDPNNDCLTSGTYDLDNSCFRCPVTNSSGTFNFCMSTRYLGYAFCSAPGSFQARIDACVALGGNTAASSYACMDSTGANKSETTGCGPSPPTQSPTDAPTNSSSTVGVCIILFITIFSLFI